MINLICDHCDTRIETSVHIGYNIAWCHDCWHSDIGKALLVKVGFTTIQLCDLPRCKSYKGWYDSEPIASKIKSIPKKHLLCPQCGEMHQ